MHPKHCFRATFKWAIAVHKAVRYMFQHLAKRGEAMGFDVGFMPVIPVLGVVARKLVQQVEGRLLNQCHGDALF